MPIEISEDGIKYIQHPGQGFFSCCTVHLQGLLSYFNMYHRTPKNIDTVNQFLWYKTPEQIDQDIKPTYFQEFYDKIIEYKKDVRIVNHAIEDQYSDYRTIQFDDLKPFIEKYFKPSIEVRNIIYKMEQKYSIDYQNICVLFFRGNDKQLEIPLPDYQLYMDQARALYRENPNIKFLVQSDETEFLNLFSTEFPNNHIIFWDEIRHIPRNGRTTVDRVIPNMNSVMSKNFLAITWIMSKCRYVICNTGNCSLWIALYRGNADNMVQFCYYIP
jgi:hypothetical protein